MKKIPASDVIVWAKDFLAKAEDELTPGERKEQKLFASLVTKPENKTLLIKLLDESSQIRDRKTMAERLKVIFQEYGVPDFMGKSYEALGYLYKSFGYYFDSLAVPAFKKVLRQETGKIIIGEERPMLTRHLARRWEEGIGQNVNLLGEVVLGDAEATARYEHYLEALTEPDINYISIKISGIYAQLYPLSYNRSKEELCLRIAAIFQQAIDNPYTDRDGRQQAKFVNLDMEEYKDSELTLEVFKTVMSMPQFKHYMAGIVVQAYLPDAMFFYDELLEFAKARVAEGGKPIKVRLVKGANLQMETIISSLKGWPNPIWPTKVDVDANYLHILDKALLPENARAVHIGVASHNFFTLGYAAMLSRANGVEDCVTFEMLEGMANHLPRLMKKMGKQVILYTPVVKKEYFLNAVSYLVRRLDENTGEDNFLRYSFSLKLDSRQWRFLCEQFEQAHAKKDSIRPYVARMQNRNQKPVPPADIDIFHNEPDTDLDLKQNRQWALEALKKWENMRDSNFVIPVQVGDREEFTEKKRKYYDRSKNDSVSFCEVNMASQEQVAEIVQIAEDDASGWRVKTLAERNRILHDVAEELAANRGDLIGCMSAITGKTFMEGDVEVSEAIDFCRYYPISFNVFERLEAVENTPKGVVLVIPPWNFPLAIPVGGVAAGLTAGNSVILKPATVAFPVAWKFAECFWRAGVPKDALQLVCPADRSSLNWLSIHPAVKHTILTGGTDTAYKLQLNAPRKPLSAETGGKNAIIVTAAADQDKAILNVVSSAFGNAGQKCSACSLLLLDRRTYESETFKNKLKDAVMSLHTGSVWETDNIVGPMITNSNDKLLHAIDNLEPGEEWLVAPVFADEKRYILKPTVKWGVKPGSYTFRTELFAPLLAVVCIDGLDQGLKFANSTEYGLTSGLQTLDERQIVYWKDNMEAGNLYIDRGITGAIVRRQPFGGMKRSAFGAGIKAGGPNYVSCFVRFSEKPMGDIPESHTYPFVRLVRDGNDKKRLQYAYLSYEKAWRDEFSVERDVSHIVGEKNTLRYLPLRSMAVRVQENDTLCDVLLTLYAAGKTGTNVVFSVPSTYMRLEALKEAIDEISNVQIRVQKESDFVAELELYERVRACSEGLSDAVYERAAELGLYIAAERPVVEGRIEILHYLKEQSISYEYHRYGSIVEEPKI